MARQQESWLRRNKQYVIVGCAAVAGTVAAYKVYRSERVKATQEALQSLQDTIAKYSGAADAAGDVLARVAEDLRQFLASDTEDVPRSIKQLGKLVRSADVQDTLAACVSSAVKGMMATAPAADGLPAEPSVVDKVIEALLSDRGQSLVGLAVRTAAQTSSDAFCSALVQGVQAAVGSRQVQQQPQESLQQQRHQVHAASSISSSPLSSPARIHHSHHPGALHPAVATLVSVLGSPHVLNLIDNLVSVTVGSAVGAYVQKAGQESMMTSFMDCLAQPGNKEIIIEVMSSVSAAFCREMAAACVAPASSVATRPPSRLDSLEQHSIHVLQQAAAASSPLKALHPSRSAGEEGSGPSTPQSGPSTPEPSIVASPAAGVPLALGRGSFAGSAVAGLIMRRNSFPGAGWGGNGSNLVDPAALGPMSTVVSLFVQAARFQEFRSLMVDVTRSSTREFVLSLLPSSWSLTAGGRTGSPLATATLTACLYRVYTSLCVLMFLVLYAVGPKTMFEGARV